MLTEVSVDGHKIPEYAKCYCVVKHTPMYTHLIPFYVPDGQVLYLCPTSHHCVSTLLGLYHRLEGMPDREILGKFSVFSQRLAKMCWHIEIEDKKALERLQNAE